MGQWLWLQELCLSLSHIYWVSTVDGDNVNVKARALNKWKPPTLRETINAACAALPALTLGLFRPVKWLDWIIWNLSYHKTPNTELRWLPGSLLKPQIRVLSATLVVLLGEFPDPRGKSDAGGGPQAAGPTAPWGGTRPKAGGSYFLLGPPLFTLCVLTAVRETLKPGHNDCRSLPQSLNHCL